MILAAVWSPAMLATHVPYFVAATILILIVRRTRRSIERIATRLEERDRR